MKYCPNCDQHVKPVKKPFSMVMFFVWLGMPYAFYHMMKPKNKCPICGMKVKRKKV